MTSTKTISTVCTALLLAVSACGEGPAPPSASATSAATVDDVLVPARGTWWASPLGGDRGTAWRAADYDPSAHTGWVQQVAPMGYGETYVNPLPFGSDPNQKPITVYFSRTFTLDDPARVLGLRIQAMYDDGLVFYINGQEAGRTSMPTGPVAFGTLAIGHEAENRYASIDVSAARGLLRAGSNTVAVEVHQAAPSSSDLVFDLALIAQVNAPPPPPPEHGIARGSTWSYWDRGGDLGSAWRQPGFDASSWASAPAPLGYGETYLASNVSYGPDAASKYVTTYFRTQFLVDDATIVSGLHAHLLYDDGLVVYLNGHEVGRQGLAAGASASTFATSHEANDIYEDFNWGAQTAWLVSGVNTIAVEVHQTSAASSDLVFDLALDLDLAPLPPPTISRNTLWSYTDQRADLGSAWRFPGYGWSGWSSGFATFGYGESYLRTLLSFGADPSNKPITAYFITAFHLEDLQSSRIYAIRGQLMYDDGAVIYLNGQEIQRLSMPTGPITASTLALGHEANNAYEAFDLTPAASLLQNGDNLVAVEVHQAAASSSDLVFDFGLHIRAIPMFTRQSRSPVLANPTPSPDQNAWDEERSDPSVLHEGSRWVMYYTGNDGFGAHYQIGRAVSSDGGVWTADPAPLFVGSAPSVLSDGTTYRMWYDDLAHQGIRLATSTDGVTWTQAASNPVLRPGNGWEVTVQNPSVIRDGSVYKMWYEGQASTGSFFYVGYAVSSDGVTWTKNPSPVILTACPALEVINDAGEYKMWFVGEGNHTIDYATSLDGRNWTKWGESLPRAAAGSWDELVHGPAVVRDYKALRMWYAGTPPENGGFQIGAALFP